MKINLLLFYKLREYTASTHLLTQFAKLAYSYIYFTLKPTNVELSE